MTNNQNQPNQYDAVLGGNSPPPIHGAVLGGIEGVKKRLASSDVDVQISALNDALNYGDVGLDLVINALESKSTKVRKSAYNLLGNRNEPKAEQLLWRYKFSRERAYEIFDFEDMYSPFEEFYNCKVKIYDSKTGIDNSDNSAYVINKNNFDSLLNERLANRIKALIIRSGYNESFISSSDKFSNLKAIFIGAYDLYDSRKMYQFPIWNIGSILKAYPKLELLQLRCVGDFHNPNWLFFKKFEHHNLKALVLKTIELDYEKITQILSLELSALEHLELWISREDYNGITSIEHLTPLLSGEIFPKLYYLGLRNSELTDEIAEAIVDSPIINQIKILDLSMGYLTDEGATALLNCPSVNDLDILNVACNRLSKQMVDKLIQLDTEIIADNQNINKTVPNRYEPTWE